MSDIDDRLREFGGGLRSILEGFLGTSRDDVSEKTLSDLFDPSSHITFGPETRRARLFTEFTVGGQQFSFEALGKRGCSTNSVEFRVQRGTQVYNLTCSSTFFAADNTPLGPVRIVQDPRIVNRGWIFLRRNRKGQFVLPGLSFFNQHLIFHVGDRFLYYPRAWQVVSAITEWPPEFFQYHHLEEDTPVFDFITKEPNVARKGISTISIEDKLTPEEEKRMQLEEERELAIIRELPASKMSPEDLTPAQGDNTKRG
jgi:hypothetical protein